MSCKDHRYICSNLKEFFFQAEVLSPTLGCAPTDPCFLREDARIIIDHKMEETGLQHEDVEEFGGKHYGFLHLESGTINSIFR